MEKKSIGAWKRQTSKGEVIGFTIDGKKYTMWPNSYKKESKHPDFNITEDKPFENKTIAENKVKKYIDDAIADDDLPF